MENNPLKQYFRRPVIYFKLPSDGRYYAPGVINWPSGSRELPVYSMTAIDEMTVRTPDALFNGTAVVDLIKSCIPNIVDPWAINSIDLDAVIVAIRAASNNGKLDIETTCPACEETTSYDINLMNMLGQLSDVDYNIKLELNELKFKFRPLTQAESNKNEMSQFEIQKLLATLEDFQESEEKKAHMTEAIKRMNSLVMKIISSTIEYIETPESRVTEQMYIHDFLVNTDKGTNDAIREYSLKLKNESQLKPIHIKCIHCANEYDQKVVLNVTDFFG
jgi:hypothetical protein